MESPTLTPYSKKQSLAKPFWFSVVAMLLFAWSSLYGEQSQFGLVAAASFFMAIAIYKIATYNYRGTSSKIIYVIFRVVLALLIAAKPIYYIFRVCEIDTSVSIWDFQHVYNISWYSVVGYLSISWYLIAFKPSNTEKKQKACKVIGYALLWAAIVNFRNVNPTIYYDFKINTEFISLIGFVSLVGYIFLYLGYRKSNNDNTFNIDSNYNANSVLDSNNNQYLYQYSNKVTHSPKTSIKIGTDYFKIIRNIIITVLMILIFYFATLWSNNSNTKIWCWFYRPYFGFIFIYYEWLIWRAKTVNSSDILLFPVLKKMGLFRNYLDYDKPIIKDLLKSVFPALLISIVLPLIVTLLYKINVIILDKIDYSAYDFFYDVIEDKYYYIEKGIVKTIHLLLATPILVWILALAYIFAKDILYKEVQNQEKDN